MKNISFIVWDFFQMWLKYVFSFYKSSKELTDKDVLQITFILQLVTTGERWLIRFLLFWIIYAEAHLQVSVLTHKGHCTEVLYLLYIKSCSLLFYSLL